MHIEKVIHGAASFHRIPAARDHGPVSPADGAGRAFTLVELLVVIGIIGLLASMLLPALSRAKAKALNTVCINSLRQLGMAARMYAEDNNNLMPSAEIMPSAPVNPAKPLPRICDVLAPYVVKASAETNSAAIFKCPADHLKRFATEGSSYEWNTTLNGHRLDEVLQSGFHTFGMPSSVGGGVSSPTNGVLRFPPVETPLLFDYDDIHPRGVNSGKNAVFMDGHVAALGLQTGSGQ